MKCGGCGGRLRRRPSHAHSFSLFAVRYSSPAFSLAELMIATVILGVGLLIVAGMFPVAWMKARDQVEETSLANAASAAETLLRAKFRAAKYSVTREQDDRKNNPTGANPYNWFDPASFLSDLGIYFATDVPTWCPGTDNRVHPVNVQNMLVDPAGYPVSPPTGEPRLVEELFVPEELHRVDFDTRFVGSIANLVLRPTLPRSHARFEERLVPPMPLWPAATDSTFDPAANPEIVDHWRATLRSRRYCWAVLARMDNGYWTTDYNNNPHPDLIRGKVTYSNPSSWYDSRAFTMYYVTLRRSQETQRFAQQAFLPATDRPPVLPLVGAAPATPRALPPDRDTVFPVPWRVQIFVPEPVDLDDPAAARGIPAEVEVNSANVPTGPIVTGMLPRGAFLIDELNGNVYKVMRRRLYNNDQSAVLTLDKEITHGKIKQGEIGQAQPGSTGPELRYNPDRDRLRTVWVFPPSVEVAGRDATQPSDSVVFDGTQPVVGIEIRPMVLTP